MLQNGVQAMVKMNNTKNPNNNINSNNLNSSSIEIENQDEKIEFSIKEILLLIDIKVNEINQLSNIYLMAIDQGLNQVVDYQNIEIGQEATSIRLKQALCAISGIHKKFSSNSNIFIVYPKKSIPKALFRIFRQFKFSPGELSFTNTYISLGQLMPSSYVLDESILFNNLISLMDITKDDEIAQKIFPMQTSMVENNNQNSQIPIQNHESFVIGQDCKQNGNLQIFKSHSSSLDLHRVQINQQSNLLSQNRITKESISALEAANQVSNSQQDNMIPSSQSITLMQQASSSQPPSTISSTSNTPTQQQLLQNTSQIISNDKQKIDQPQKQNTKNISYLFDISNNSIKNDSLQGTSLYQNDVSLKYQYSSKGIQETTIFQSLQSPMINRSYSVSLDTGSKIGGSSLFSGSSIFNTSGNESNRSNNLYKPSSSWIFNPNISPLAPISEKIQEEKLDEEKIDKCNDNPAPQKIQYNTYKDSEFQSINGNGQISSSSSICSTSTFSSKQVMNEQYLNGQQKGQKYSSQLNFFILILKLIKQGFQFKKECVINFKNNLTQEIKLKYSQKILDIIQDAQMKSSKHEMILEENQISSTQQIQAKSNQQQVFPRQPEQILSKKSSQIIQFQQNQSILSKKQTTSQANSSHQNQQQSNPLFQGGDHKTIMQENLIARSKEIQIKLSKNEENKTLDLLFVIDFECNQPGYEIIEFPILVIDLKKQRIIDTFHTYVKPTISPKINPYISKMTGIVQKDVATALPFVQVVQKVETFLLKYKDYEGCILYDCDSDCNYIKNEFINKNYMPKSDLFFSYINLRNVFPLEISGGVINRSLSHAQQILQMEFQGNKHKGIDDARNQALVCIELVKRGFTFSQFMIQPQFLKQEPKQCVKHNLFNLYEYNSRFLLIKLEHVLQEVPQVQQNNQRAQPASLNQTSKKYTKFTCFLTEKNDQLNQLYRVKDSTFYFDLVNAQASGAGTSYIQPHPRNINFSGEMSQENLNNEVNQHKNQNVNHGNQTPNNGSQGNQNGHNNQNQKGNNNQKHENNKGKQQNQNNDEQIKQVERAFINSFSNYLKKFSIQRNKTALVLLGFDMNEFLNFQKSFNLQQYEKDLIYNEKTIFVDGDLVQFSGFLDIYKMKDHQNQRKNSASMTPHKNRKRSMSDDLFTTNIRINQSQTIQFQESSSNNSHLNTTQVFPLRKNSLKNLNQSPIMKPQSTTQLTDTINLQQNIQKDEYTILHQADMSNQGELDKTSTKQSRKRSNHKEFHLNSYDPKGIQKQLEKQQQQQQVNTHQESTSVQVQQQTMQLNEQNNLQNTLDSNQVSNNQTTVQVNQNNSNNNNSQNHCQQGHNYTKEQMCQFLLNDEFSINFINFILVNNKKLKEYQDLAYHWQYMNIKPK